MKQLVIKGGKEKVNISQNALAEIKNLKNIEAAKFENAKFEGDFETADLQENALIQLDRVETEHEININSTKNAVEANIMNTTAKNISVSGNGAALTLSGKTTAEDIDLNGGEEAVKFKSGTETKANSLKFSGKKESTIAIDGSKIEGSVDASGVDSKTNIFLGAGSSVKDGVKFNQAEGNELVIDPTDKKLKDIKTDGKSKTRKATQNDIIKYNLDFSESGYDQYGAPQKKESWIERGLKRLRYWNSNV
jgi:hypothetical protein